ncbi:MAG: DsbA family protein [Pikeienuella sp.]
MTTNLTRRAAVAGALSLPVALSAFAAQADEALKAKGYVVGDVVIGNPDAKVEVIEYASLTCPHCAGFHERVFRQFKADYIDTGKVKFITREVYFDKFGLWGGMIARCGGEDRYQTTIDNFLLNQRAWYLDHTDAYRATQNVKPILDEMFKIGRRAGLSDDRMTECLSDNDLLENLVGDFQNYMEESGVTGTPTLFVNGQRIDTPRSANELASHVEPLL